MAKIYNINRHQIETGKHAFLDHGVLIQITDIRGVFPHIQRVNDFELVYQFRFDLVDPFDRNNPCAITLSQAGEIADILVNANLANRDVIVQCDHGERRSGAVAEIGSWLGFERDHIPDVPDTFVINMIGDVLYDRGLI